VLVVAVAWCCVCVCIGVFFFFSSRGPPTSSGRGTGVPTFALPISPPPPPPPPPPPHVTHTHTHTHTHTPQSVQAAVDHQLTNLTSSHPSQRVSLVTFGDEVRTMQCRIISVATMATALPVSVREWLQIEKQFLFSYPTLTFHPRLYLATLGNVLTYETPFLIYPQAARQGLG